MKEWMVRNPYCMRYCREEAPCSFKFVQLLREETAAVYQKISVIPYLKANMRDELAAILKKNGFQGYQDFRSAYTEESWSKTLAEWIFLYGLKDCPRHKFTSMELAEEFVKSLTASEYSREAFENSPGRICYIPENCEDANDFWTGNDFIALCGGDRIKAQMVFDLCAWQSPHTVIGEWDEDDQQALWENKGRPVPKVYVDVEDGAVTAVYTDGAMEVEVLDWDNAYHDTEPLENFERYVQEITSCQTQVY